MVTGIDISDVAIERAKARSLPNARFEIGDLMRAPFGGYDLIVAIECIYYLTADEQEAFFAKVAREHSGNIAVLTAPIIGSFKHQRYFTHAQLMATFARHRMDVIAHPNIFINRRSVVTTLAAAVVRAAPQLLDWMPEPLIYQRAYIIRMM